MNILAVKDLKMALPTGLGLAKLNGLLSVSQVRYFLVSTKVQSYICLYVTPSVKTLDMMNGSARVFISKCSYSKNNQLAKSLRCEYTAFLARSHGNNLQLVDPLNLNNRQ